jgi:hypothetical protein
VSLVYGKNIEAAHLRSLTGRVSFLGLLTAWWRPQLNFFIPVSDKVKIIKSAKNAYHEKNFFLITDTVLYDYITVNSVQYYFKMVSQIH